jgi:hypothetical protein
MLPSVVTSLRRPALTFAALFVFAGAAQSAIQVFDYTGNRDLMIVPPGTTSMTVYAYGAQGGDSTLPARRGVLAQGTMSVVPGETLVIDVGGHGSPTGAGGYNGGQSGQGNSGGGGGASTLAHKYTLAGFDLMAAGGDGGAFSVGMPGDAGYILTPGGAGGGPSHASSAVTDFSVQGDVRNGDG